MDATALAASVSSGETTAFAVMQASLQRIEERSDLGAVRYIDAPMGLAGAKACDQIVGTSRKPEFAGVPLLMKDLGNAAAGLTPVAGSAALLKRAGVTNGDSLLASSFRSVGFIPFGLTTTPEFGLALSSEPAIGPTARNPWNLELTPGGSSGGAAAAVAGGLVAIAHATDAAGSIRVPAACCGLVGLKPTRGVTPNGPAFSNHLMGLVGELVMARSVRDVRAVLALCSGKSQGPYANPHFDLTPSTKQLRIGISDSAEGIGVIGREQARAVASAGSLLKRLGHTLVQVDTNMLAGLAKRSNGIARSILSVSLAEWLAYLNVADIEVSALAAAVASEGRKLPATVLFAMERDAALVSHAMENLRER